MPYKLFLDDIRDVKMVYKNLTDEDFVIVRNFQDKTRGPRTVISKFFK
jgi:hypothetical protein